MPARILERLKRCSEAFPTHHFDDDPGVQLMLQVQRDEPGAFEKLMDAWRIPLKARFLRTLRNLDEAEDLTQEVFLRVFRIRKRYQPTARFSTWLFHITQNLARSAFQRRKKCYATNLRGPSKRNDLEALTERDDPVVWLQREETSRMVRSAVATLDRRQRAALEMFQFQNRTYAEIASELELTPEATKSLLYRARNHLRDVILTTALAAG